MTTWAQFKTDLLAQVKSFTDPAKCDVVYQDSRQPTSVNKCLIRMKITPIGGKLTEKRLSEIENDPTQLAVDYYSNRLVSVNFLFETVSQEDADTPIAIADDLTDKLQFNKINADTSFIETSDIVDVSVPVDDRMMAVVSFDARFNVLITPPVPSTETVATIKEVDLSFDLEDAPANLDPIQEPPPDGYYPIIVPEPWVDENNEPWVDENNEPWVDA